MSVNYEKYSKEEFLKDAHFVSWVKYPSPEASASWNSWIAENPANLAEFRAAEEELLLILSVNRIMPSAADEQATWAHIQNSIHASSSGGTGIVRKMRSWLIGGAVAASLIAGASVWWMGRSDPDTSISTAYNQLKKARLADKTVVDLNANSSIDITTSEEGPREVYLEGEAFFNVVHLNKNSGHIAANERFIVHTDKVNVEVLGTSFNVKERRGKTEVSLEKGSLSVQVKADSLKQLVLVPGETASYDHSTGKLSKVEDDPALHKAWTERKMLTNNTTVAEIIADLEDMYGYKITLTDPALANRKIDGIIPLKNEKNVLFILSNMLDVDITKKNDQVKITPRKR